LEKALEELKPVDVAEAVREVAELYKEAEIVLNLESVTVKANEGLKTIINNIVHNALVHGKDDGIRIKIETFSDEKYGIIRISDNGKGIPDEIKEKIFEEGFTTGEGTGLGLYIVKRIVNIYGGEIEVKDNIPKGTVFEIRIPKIKKEG
ncbi:sensor histidine kinase, partial [Archaeoglobus sp.]